MKGKIRELEGITYDIGDAEQKKVYYRHYHRIFNRNWYITHKEAHQAYSKKYVENNREKVNAYYRNRYANKTEEQKDIIREKQRIFAKEKYANDAEYRAKHIQTVLAQYYKKQGLAPARRGVKGDFIPLKGNL